MSVKIPRSKVKPWPSDGQLKVPGYVIHACDIPEEAFKLSTCFWNCGTDKLDGYVPGVHDVPFFDRKEDVRDGGGISIGYLQDKSKTVAWVTKDLLDRFLEDEVNELGEVHP